MPALELVPCRAPGLIARLRKEVDALADAAMEALVSEIPYYKTLELQQLGEVRRIAVTGTGAFLTLWGQGRLARPEELAPFRAHGAARAAEGRPLTFVLRAYRVAGRVLLKQAVHAGGEDLGVAGVANLAQLVFGFIDQLSDVVTEGYVEASEHLAAGPERARRELFEDLIAGRFASAEGVKGRAQVLGLALPDAPRVLLATLAEDTEPPLPERAAILRAQLSAMAVPPLLLITREQIRGFTTVPGAKR